MRTDVMFRFPLVRGSTLLARSGLPLYARRAEATRSLAEIFFAASSRAVNQQSVAGLPVCSNCRFRALRATPPRGAHARDLRKRQVGRSNAAMLALGR
jgi:hypothetical protein